MNNMAKTIAFWVALLVTAVLLYQVFENPHNSRETKIPFSKFLDELNNKNVKSAKIVDSDLTGELTSGGSFNTVIPADYPALYDKLQGVDVTIEHPTQSPWLAALISWAPFLFIIAFWIYVMRRMQRGRMHQDKGGASQGPGQSNVVQLDPDVAKAFSNPQAVNEALRLVIQLKQIRGTA